MIKAVIFDFNGTLFYDLDINQDGWELFYKEIKKTDKGAKEFAKEAVNMSNSKTITTMYKEMNIELNNEEIIALSHKKESYYHKLALERKRTKLADGVDEVLTYIKNKDIKLNMCTASIKYNLDFYFEITNLKDYFNKDIVSYDDGLCDGKIEMYKIAAANIGVDMKDCIVFEDTNGGISDAIKAGYNKIVYVNHYNREKLNYKEIIQEINEYSQLDYSIFD